ncbi:GDP-mannose 4,6-dehydratase [candidate division WOR-3 bacterium]|nr:GDP-mannose 4,6-dehydratase [candidate division WOR-3 bacterium]
MSRVLITGIEGFVGRHLAGRLLESGHKVIGIHLAPCTGLDRVELHCHDIRDFEFLRAVLADARPERVVHLAAVSSVAESETHVLETYDVNAVGTLRLLEAVRQSAPRARVLLVSSAEVYGRGPAAGPFTEQSPALPVSPYALSKLAAEEAGRFSHRAFGLDVVILRPFSHTGPGQSPRFVFPTVARRIAELERAGGGVIELGNLDTRRDYTDVRDICRAYELALERCEPGETYNITSSRPVLIRDGVEALCRLARVPVEYRTVAERLRERDIPLLSGSSDRFVQATGWRPEIPFDQTLTDLLAYWRTRVAADATAR